MIFTYPIIHKVTVQLGHSSSSKKLYKIDDEEIKTLLEISRILVPMSKEERAYLYDYGKKAKELAQEANMVYLYRKKLIRLK